MPVEAVFFDHGQLASQFRVGDLLDTAFRLKRTRFDGYWRLEMELLDVSAPDQAQPIANSAGLVSAPP